MLRLTLLLLAGAFVSAATLAGQSEDCQEAFEVRDQIREKWNAPSPDWKALHYKAKQQTQACDLLASLWKLREELALKIGDTRDAQLAHERRAGRLVMSDSEFEALLASKPKSFNPSAPVGKFWGLIAGTGQFTEPGKALEYASRDLQAVQSMLKGLGYPASHLLTAIGGDFTKTTLTKRIAELREKVAEDDVVILYVLTHGVEGAEDANASSILLTADSDTSSSQRRYETGIQTISLVQEVFRELKARRVVLILDTCFSGDAITGQRASAGQLSPLFLDLLTRNSGRVIITASMADQRSFELRNRSMGALAFCLTTSAQRLPSATIGELFSSTETCVADEVAKLPERVEQRPAIFASERARRIVLAPPSQ